MINKKDSRLNFIPHPLIKGGHLQTIAGYYWRDASQVATGKIHQVDVSGSDKVFLLENRASRKTAFPRAILLMHGLGGDAEAPYMIRLAGLFKERGWHVFRMNHRGAGNGSGYARQIYHSGRSDDVSAVLVKIAELYPETPLIAAGFSLSGNALLKLLGEKRDPIPDNLRGAIAVTPPIELAACADALAKKRNILYNIRFIRRLRNAIAERQQAFADFPAFDLKWNMSLRDFDDICTAPLNSFDSARDYYDKCSARQFLAEITLPTFILASADDPFIPKQCFENLPANRFLDVHIAVSGGHMGFIAARVTPLGDRRWMDYVVLNRAELQLKRAVNA